MSYITTLKNGIRILSIPSQGSTITLNFGIKIPYVSPIQFEKHHFLEHLYSEKISKFKYNGKTLGNLGYIIEAFTSETEVVYELTGDKKDQDSLINIFFCVCDEHKLPGNELDKERKILIEEVKYRTIEKAEEKLMAEMFTQSYYGISLEEKEENINKITFEELLEQQDDFYVSENMFAIVCGKDIKKLTKKVINKLSKVPKRELKQEILTQPTNKIIPGYFYGKYYDLEAPSCKLFIKIPTKTTMSDIDYYYYDALGSIVFGSILDSYIMQQVRVKDELIYTVNYHFDADVYLKERSHLNISLDIDCEKFDKTVKSVIDLLMKIHEEGISKFDLEKYVKATKLKLEQNMLNLSNTQLVLKDRNYFIHQNDLYNYKTDIEILNKMNVQKLNKILSETVNYKNLNVMLVVNKEDL